MNRRKAEQTVHLVMEGLDLNLTQAGLCDTPRRVISMLIDAFFREICAAIQTRFTRYLSPFPLH
jgi:GTP cyclohydrolase I